MNIYDMSNEELENKLKENKRKRLRMFWVFFIVLLLNIAFVTFVGRLQFNNPFVQIFISTPLCVVNCLSIWWLCLGGRWK